MTWRYSIGILVLTVKSSLGVQWSCVQTLAELLGGERAAQLLRSRVREMELPGSRFGHVADKDVISCEAFARFVAEILRAPPAQAWEALQIVCGITHLYKMALTSGSEISSDKVTWQQLEALSPALQATRAEDKKCAAKIWRAISPRGDAATLPMMLHGLLVAQSASPAVKLEKDLAAAYASFRATHLRAAAAARTITANRGAKETTYVLEPGHDAVMLEVLCAYTGQLWLALFAIPGMNSRHAGYLLRSVDKRDVGGEDPAITAKLMQQRPVELTFVDITDGMLGDARFAALLENRKVRQEQVEAVAPEQEEAEHVPESTDVGEQHGCSEAVESLVRFMFKGIDEITHPLPAEGTQKGSSLPRGTISAKVAALSVHCLNHSITHGAVFNYVKEIHDSGSAPGDPEDAEFAFREAGLDCDPYSGDEGNLPGESQVIVSQTQYSGVWEIVNDVICRKEPSRRSPVTAELPRGHKLAVTKGVMLPDQSIRLYCENGWFSAHSQNGLILARKLKNEKNNASNGDRDDSASSKMPAEADEIPVDLETFMCLVGGAERHPSFRFTDFLEGLREVMAVEALFRTMDMYSTGRATIVEFSMLVQQLGVTLEVHQVRDLWSQVIGDEDHSATNVRSIDFAGLLQGMEDIRLASRNPGATVVRLFRAAVLEEYGPGSHIDRLLAQFLSSRGAASLNNADTQAELLLRLVFDVCDRTSKATETTGFVDARIAAMIIHSAVHEIDYSAALRQTLDCPVMTDYVETYKRFHDSGVVDLYTDEEEELRESDEKPNFVYAGKYTVSDASVELYNEASQSSGCVTNAAGEVCRLIPGETVTVTEGQCIPWRKCRNIDGSVDTNWREMGKLMLRCSGHWLDDSGGWIDPIGEDGNVCLRRADGKSFKVQMEAVDTQETTLQSETRADKQLVGFESLSRYMQVAKRNPKYKFKRFLWGMHEVLAAATLFRACDTRFLGRVALIDLSALCSRLKIQFTIEELEGVWWHMANECKVISFGQFLEGTMILRNATMSVHAHAIRKFRRLLLTHNGLGRSVDSMLENARALPIAQMAVAFGQDEAEQAEQEDRKQHSLVYVDGIGFAHQKSTRTEKRTVILDNNEAAAEAAAIAAKNNPNARKSYKAGNKWHESSVVTPRARSPRSPRSSKVAKSAAEQVQKEQLAGRYETVSSYTQMLATGASSGNLDSVRLALRSGADVLFAGSCGRTPLITATMHGHVDVVAELVAAPLTPIDAVDFVYGWTALMYAGRWGLEHIVQLLLDSGAGVEIVDNDGQSVRELAYDWGYNIIISLLDRRLGLDIELPDASDEVLRAEDLTLMQAIGVGDVLRVMDALTDGANADCVDTHGNTPLIAAINAGRSDIVAVLLDDASLAFDGADVNTKGVAGWTPFMYACRWGQLDTMTLLLANGADVAVEGEDGSTARGLLQEYEHEDLIEVVLLFKGADIDVPQF